MKLAPLASHYAPDLYRPEFGYDPSNYASPDPAHPHTGPYGAPVFYDQYKTAAHNPYAVSVAPAEPAYAPAEPAYVPAPEPAYVPAPEPAYHQPVGYHHGTPYQHAPHVFSVFNTNYKHPEPTYAPEPAYAPAPAPYHAPAPAPYHAPAPHPVKLHVPVHPKPAPYHAPKPAPYHAPHHEDPYHHPVSSLYLNLID